MHGLDLQGISVRYPKGQPRKGPRGRGVVGAWQGLVGVVGKYGSAGARPGAAVFDGLI